MTRMGHPLVDEVAKKASIAWLDGRAAWCAWFDDALYAISGPGEQDLGELTSGVGVTLRGDHGGRVVSWPAAVARVAPGSEEPASELKLHEFSMGDGLKAVILFVRCQRAELPPRESLLARAAREIL